jgi:hypothetical protein
MFKLILVLVEKLPHIEPEVERIKNMVFKEIHEYFMTNFDAEEGGIKFCQMFQFLHDVTVKSIFLWLYCDALEWGCYMQGASKVRIHFEICGNSHENYKNKHFRFKVFQGNVMREIDCAHFQSMKKSA